MIKPGDVISYLEMCQTEGVNLQRGMNFRLHSGYSLILMSVRKGAPYADVIEDNGRVLTYEGHDVPKQGYDINPKVVDQPMINPSGTLTQNGLFYKAATEAKKSEKRTEPVRVYEKIHSGIWVYNGLFKLVDAWQETSNARKVFKFRLELADDLENVDLQLGEVDHSRLIPAQVKLEVWKRDKGQCVVCGSKDNLHFDHIIPYSKGGSSLVAENIQLLCARHNIAKRDRIE
ncbi:MAG: HNH endonuclease [Dehalococcoidia bacterium]|nr:HNH endonuclease [Dehalococcoidia bacterium]